MRVLNDFISGGRSAAKCRRWPEKNHIYESTDWSSNFENQTGQISCAIHIITDRDTDHSDNHQEVILGQIDGF
jgi:hypothetical protein